MASEGAEKNNFLTPGGQFNVPEKLSLENFTTGSTTDQCSDTDDDDQDPVRDGVYDKNSENAESPASTTTSETDVAGVKPEATSEAKTPDLVERYDPTKPMALLKLFGDLIITHEANTQMPDTRLANAAKDTPPVPEAVDEDQADTYNGNELTQSAFASLAKHVPRESEILDRVMQTLDRLTRQPTRSQFDNSSEIA